MSTMDNASAQLAIALQLHDLNELEAAGTVDAFVIRLQRQQLEIDSGFDAVTFEASRRLALSMAKAVQDDSVLLTQLAPSPQIDKATLDRLASWNKSPSTSSSSTRPPSQLICTERTLSSTVGSLKRARSLTPEREPPPASSNTMETELSHHIHTDVDQTRQPHKKVRVEQVISEQNSSIPVENSEMSSAVDSHASTADVGNNQIIQETSATTIIETPPSTADCASCSDHLTIDKLVKAACKHHYCKKCFGEFIEASLQTNDGFPPKCCKIPIPLITVAYNVSAAVYSRYSARQVENKNATTLYCGIRGCGVRIEEDRIVGVRAICVACWRDTCTQCRGAFPNKIIDKNVGHVCQRDEAREQVLALAKEQGWQTCYQCGNLIALNFGSPHMR